MPLQTVALYLLSLGMVIAGVQHFRRPKGYIRIMPAWLPAHSKLVMVSGVCEVLGGLGLLVPQTQSLAAWGLVALFIAVFPANVNMALHGISFGRTATPRWLLWVRLPVQGVLVAWAWWLT